MHDVRRITRRAYRHDGLHRRQILSHRENGGSAETMPDEQGRRHVGGLEKTRCGNEVGDVRREIRVCELPLTGPDAREIEPQYCDPVLGQTLCDPARSENILAARKAVREERVCAHRVVWRIEPGCQLLPVCAREHSFRRLHRESAG
jgi:hypothetical protein